MFPPLPVASEIEGCAVLPDVKCEGEVLPCQSNHHLVGVSSVGHEAWLPQCREVEGKGTGTAVPQDLRSLNEEATDEGVSGLGDLAFHQRLAAHTVYPCLMQT